MILKKTWIEILQQNNTGNYSLSQAGLLALIQEVDALFTSQYKSGTGVNDYRLTNIYTEIVSHFVVNTKADNYWADMPIFVSSYSWKDKTPFGETILRLTQYLGFYKKILTDKGLARSVITHREYDNRGNSDGTTKSYNSETPQISLDNFDDAIKYASNLAKNEDLTHSRTYGDSDLTVSSKSWDEEEKNLKYLFYNDLCDYMRQIPRYIYSEYSLDTAPADFIVEETFKYFKDMYERR